MRLVHSFNLLLFLCAFFGLQSCGSSSSPSSTISSGSNFGGGSSSPIGTLEDEAQDFDDQLEQQQDNQPDPITEEIVENNHEIQSVMFLEGGENTNVPLPSQYDCSEGGVWSHNGTNLGVVFQNESCSASISFDQASADALNTNDLISTLTFEGVVRYKSSNQDVNLKYTIETRRAPKVQQLPPPLPVAPDGPQIPFAQKSVFTPGDVEQLVAASDLPDGEVSEPAQQLTVYAQERKQVPLGTISSFQNTASADREHFLLLPKAVGTNKDHGDVVWNYRLPQIPIPNGTWVNGELLNETCEILHNQEAYGLPNVQKKLALYEDRDEEASGPNGLFCPLQVLDFNIENGVVKLKLHTFDPEALTDRRALAGLDGYMLAKGKNNNTLRLSFFAKYENESGSGNYLFEFVLKLNSIEQNPIKITKYEPIANTGECQYFVTKGSIPMTHLWVSRGLKEGQRQAGEGMSVRTVVVSSEAEDQFVFEKVQNHFGYTASGNKGVHYWINLNDSAEEGVWDVLLNETAEQPDRYEPEYFNWYNGETPVRAVRDCAFIYGRKRHRTKMNDAYCPRSRFKHVIEACPADSNGTDLPIDVLD